MLAVTGCGARAIQDGVPVYGEYTNCTCVQVRCDAALPLFAGHMSIIFMTQSNKVSEKNHDTFAQF